MTSAQVAGSVELDALFAPRSVAVLGASADPTKIGGRPLAYLRRSGFAGHVYPINPKYDDVQGWACVASVTDAPEAPDLALVALPAAAVPAALRDCAERGVRCAIVFSSGFAEAGAGGEALQAQVTAIARTTGMRVVGPNSIGVVSPPAALAATFATALERPGEMLGGSTAFVSQSGALAAFLYAQAHDAGLGFSRFVSVGNEADLTVADFLHVFAADPETRLVCGYLEGVSDGRALMNALDDLADAGKAVAFLKVGRSERGARAAASHTGSLAGAEAVYAAAFRQAGVLRIPDLGGLLDLMRMERPSGALDAPRATGPVAVLTISGGAGVWAADRLADAGVALVDLSEATVARLADVLPSFAATANPVDVTGQVVNDPVLFEACLLTLVDDDAVGSVLVLLGLQESGGEALARAIAGCAGATDKLVAVSWMAGPAAAYRVLEDAGVPVFEDMSRCVDALASAIGSAARLEQVRRAGAVRPAPAAAQMRLPPGALTEHAAKAALREMGVPVPAGRLVHSADGAVAAAEAIGFPVALKGQSVDVHHKTEHQLVRLGLRDAAGVHSAHLQLVGSARAAGLHGDGWRGVLVEAMAPDGLDTVVGVVRDPVFGPVVMFGLGGVMVELVGDVAFRVAPIGAAEADALIGDTKGSALLDGFRGALGFDRPALVETLVAVSRFAADHAGAIAEIEINPLRVLAPGQGVLALDAVLTTTTSAEGAR